MFEDPQDEMRQFIVDYLRQITVTGMPVEAVIEDAGFWRIEAREEGAWALIQERPDGGGSEEKGRAADRQTALTIAGIFNALASDPEGMSSDLAERAYADMAVAGPAQKELWARILRGLLRNPLALEMYLEGAGENLPPEAHDILLQRLDETQVN